MELTTTAAPQLAVSSGFVADSRIFPMSKYCLNPIIDLNLSIADLIRSYLLISSESLRIIELMDIYMGPKYVLGLLRFVDVLEGLISAWPHLTVFLAFFTVSGLFKIPGIGPNSSIGIDPNPTISPRGSMAALARWYLSIILGSSKLEKLISGGTRSGLC